MRKESVLSGSYNLGPAIIDSPSLSSLYLTPDPFKFLFGTQANNHETRHCCARWVLASGHIQPIAQMLRGNEEPAVQWLVVIAGAEIKVEKPTTDKETEGADMNVIFKLV
jgi:hypothetical protein